MSYHILACEVLRPELELLARNMDNPPAMTFLEQRLHDYPEKLRAGVQEQVTALENAGETRIVMGYGLCGRGLCGVHAQRATLIYPRLHDCIPLLIGADQQTAILSSREGATYWITPGWLDYFLVDFHINWHKRLAVYVEKFGEKRGMKMLKAEDALLSDYKCTCHIRWAEMGDGWVEKARKVAENTNLPYTEMEGKSGYMNELLHGGLDQSRFLHLEPGQTINMDTDGGIIASSSDEVKE